MSTSTSTPIFNNTTDLRGKTVITCYGPVRLTADFHRWIGCNGAICYESQTDPTQFARQVTRTGDAFDMSNIQSIEA